MQTTPSNTGSTIRSFQRHQFWLAVDAYRAALESGDPKRIVAASIVVHAARTDNTDTRIVNQVWRDTKRKVR